MPRTGTPGGGAAIRTHPIAYAYVQPAGYRSTYPSRADRLSFTEGFGANKGLRLLYGRPRDLFTVEGYSAWRVGGVLAIAAAAFGLFAAVRALRGEEDAGRTELVLAGALTRRSVHLAAAGAIGAGIAGIWLAELVGLMAGGLPVAGSANLALAAATPAAVFAGVGALTSQLAPTRRMALALGGLVLGAAFVLPARDAADPRPGLLGSPATFAVRTQRAAIVTWVLAVAAFSFLMGIVSDSISTADVPDDVQEQLAKFGSGSILTPVGYLGFVFLFVVVAVSAYACVQVGAARQEEAGQQLETTLAQPVGRIRWFASRLAVALGAMLVVALGAGVATWAGARAAGVRIALPWLLEAGLNAVPAAVLFLGVAALAYAVVPRASTGIAYALLTVAFLWQVAGSLLEPPRWVLDLTPFGHVAPVRPSRSRASPRWS